jgi:hypothetical protein
MVVRRTLQLALALGAVLAGGLAAGQAGIGRLFTADPAVLGALAAIMPAVVSLGGAGCAERAEACAATVGTRRGIKAAGGLGAARLCKHHALCRLCCVQVATQPLNALAFLMDGVLYGLPGGFAFAAKAMALACVPAGAVMLAGSRLAAQLPAVAVADGQLAAVWAGLGTLMLLRFATLFIPLLSTLPPFDHLKR